MDTMKVTFNLVCTTRRDAENRWVASCPRLDVFSQGPTELQAKAALQEAIELWVESCLERETLEEALVECGFHRISKEEAVQSHEVFLIEPGSAGDVSTFNLALTIPAYQAAAALALAHA